ncbi:hypothetical protein JI58_04650 [Marinosulfonomonas sp. PRT-SC04]|nr:hypothetical protein JI58_04650 [Marinosulfonomonas sp. PRT-SC04]
MVDASGGDILEKKKPNFNKIVVISRGGTGGDADGRKRRRPFTLHVRVKGCAAFLLFINIRAAGI